MTRGRYGLIAGIAGAALAAWYWRGRHRGQDTVGYERVETIFSNTPIPSSEGIL